MDTQLENGGQYMLRSYLIYEAHKTKFQLYTYVIRVDLFNGNNIHIVRFAVTPEINMADKKRK